MKPQSIISSSLRADDRFQSLYEGSPVPIFVWQKRDDDFIFVAYNHAAGEMTLNKVDSLLGERATVFFADTPDLLEYLKLCFSERRTIRKQTLFRLHSTGVLKDIEVSFVFVPPDQVLVHTADISEKTRAEAAWREAERKYRDIFENATEGVFQTTPDGTFLTANPALANMLGFDSPEELINARTDISRQHYVDEKRREEFKRLLAEYGVVRGFEYQAYRKDNSRIWISDNVRAVRDSTGSVIYYEGTAVDVTERRLAEEALRQSEERYRELFENSRDAIYVHDLSGRYTSVNRAAEELSGYSREEILGQSFEKFIAPEDLPQVREHLCRKLGSQGETTYEIGIRTKDGRTIPVEVSSRLIYQNDIPIGIQGTARDVTERRRAQEALEQFSRRLISAQEEERQRIARELHDEIGQALTAVRLNLKALQSSCRTPESLPYIEENINVVDEAVRLVSDLSFDLRPSLLDDLGLVAAVQWYVAQCGRRSGLKTDLRCDSLPLERRLPRSVETAAFRILQEALTNILRHAQATHVAVKLQLVDGRLILTVSDDGIGFEHALGQKMPASTLGLRGMQERAVALNGRLDIESTISGGTRIRASLPFET